MGLEVAGFISELVATNPVGAVDDYATADDHLRLIKAVLQGQFPNFGASAANATIAELNTIVGVTSGIQAQIDGKAPSAHSHTAGEISDLDTSDITTGVFADARIQASNVTQHEGAIDHNSLLNWLVSEHIAWGTAGAGTIHDDHLPVAATGDRGIIELATQAEVDTGTDALRAVAPSTAPRVFMLDPGVSISFGADGVWETISDGALAAAGARWALLRVFCSIAPTSSSFGANDLNIRETGSGLASGPGVISNCCRVTADADASGNGQGWQVNDCWVKLNGSQDFDIMREQTGTGTANRGGWILGYST